MNELRERFRALDTLEVPDVLARARSIGPRSPDPEPTPRVRRVGAYVLAAVIATLAVIAIARALVQPERPADEPKPQGIFSGVGGWITYADQKGTSGIWAVNPEALGDPKDQILLSRGTGWPIAWSSDGSQLLILRTNTERPQPPQGFFGKNLFVLNADGTETRVTEGDALITGGSFSPDGSKVIYATTIGVESSRILVVDAAGSTPQALLTGNELYTPTFSPDGSQIAYFAWDGRRYHVRVMNADGSGSRVLSHDVFRDTGHFLSLVWSPDGTRLAIDYGGDLYTVRADGSDLTLVIPNGRDPNWSPDGTRIAYSHRHQLKIADADGTNTEEFGYARSGPWNPLVQPEP